MACVAGMVGTTPSPGVAGMARTARVAALGFGVCGTATTSPRRFVARCAAPWECSLGICGVCAAINEHSQGAAHRATQRSEEHTSELQSRPHLVCRLLLEQEKK